MNFENTAKSMYKLKIKKNMIPPQNNNMEGVVESSIQYPKFGHTAKKISIM